MIIACLPRRGHVKFPTPPYIPTAAYAGVENKGCFSGADTLMSSHAARTPPIFVEAPAIMPGHNKEIDFMTLTLKGLDKRGRNAIYTGAAVNLRLAIGLFPNKTAPSTIDIADGVLAGPKVKAERKRLTKEERAALPKPTAAEKIAKLEAKTAALRTKLAAEQPAL